MHIAISCYVLHEKQHSIRYGIRSKKCKAGVRAAKAENALCWGFQISRKRGFLVKNS